MNPRSNGQLEDRASCPSLTHSRPLPTPHQGSYARMPSDMVATEGSKWVVLTFADNMRDFLVVPPTSNSSTLTRCETTISVPKWYCMKSVVVKTHTWPIRDSSHTVSSSRKGSNFEPSGTARQRCRILMVLRRAGAPAHQPPLPLPAPPLRRKQRIKRGDGSSKLQASDELLQDAATNVQAERQPQSQAKRYHSFGE